MEIDLSGYYIIGFGTKMPNPFINEKVRVAYEEADGNLYTCEAVFTRDCQNRHEFKPYFKRESNGAKMTNVVAWKRRTL